jgi:hypothetical protein
MLDRLQERPRTTAELAEEFEFRTRALCSSSAAAASAGTT